MANKTITVCDMVGCGKQKPAGQEWWNASVSEKMLMISPEGMFRDTIKVPLTPDICPICIKTVVDRYLLDPQSSLEALLDPSKKVDREKLAKGARDV